MCAVCGSPTARTRPQLSREVGPHPLLAGVRGTRQLPIVASLTGDTHTLHVREADADCVLLIGRILCSQSPAPRPLCKDSTPVKPASPHSRSRLALLPLPCTLLSGFLACIPSLQSTQSIHVCLAIPRCTSRCWGDAKGGGGGHINLRPCCSA